MKVHVLPTIQCDVGPPHSRGCWSSPPPDSGLCRFSPLMKVYVLLTQEGVCPLQQAQDFLANPSTKDPQYSMFPTKSRKQHAEPQQCSHTAG
ncbi:mCG1027650 [Mus musculus]|nr:mCG1027650 [Mus musculus]